MSIPQPRLRSSVLAALFALLLGIIALSLSSSATAATVSSETARTIQSELERYITTTESGMLYFDEDAARADGADAFTLEAGNNFNIVSFAYEAAKHPEYAERAGFPVWGNWCGPGHSAPGAPKDLLDTACMHHDKCYASRGYLACSCDQALINEIKRNLSRMDVKQRAMAAAIMVFFEQTPCNPFA